MKRFLKFLVMALVLYVLAAVSVRIAPTPGGWIGLLVEGVIVVCLFVALFVRPKRKL